MVSDSHIVRPSLNCHAHRERITSRVDTGSTALSTFRAHWSSSIAPGLANATGLTCGLSSRMRLLRLCLRRRRLIHRSLPLSMNSFLSQSCWGRLIWIFHIPRFHRIKSGNVADVRRHRAWVIFLGYLEARLYAANSGGKQFNDDPTNHFSFRRAYTVTFRVW